jgi:F-type H+-transporting ATPase subunit alpha
MISRIKQEISHYDHSLEVDVGRVVEVGDGIAWIHGLRNAMAGEMLEFENKESAQAFNLEPERIGAIIFGDYCKIKEGDGVKLTGKLLSIPVGSNLLGRVVNPLVQPKDGGVEIAPEKYRPVESPAPGIADRKPVCQPLQTGIKSIDAMIPIGRGQRELIIGDRKTGKTAIAIDTIIAQKKENVICVYVAIGQKESTVAKVVHTLRKYGAMDYTIVVSASSSESAALQYLAPYAGCTIAEYFMYEQKRDILVIYDDLSKHAAAFRQISLLLRMPPGREAYPGNIFYLHSRLLERAVKLSDDWGGGSLTALPIVETQEGEVSAYIPTNIISITDGQIYLIPELFFAGVRPAIDVGISVSRVGGKAQLPVMQAVAKNLRIELAQYRELEAFSQLGTELDRATQKQLERGQRLIEVLKQGQYATMPVSDQIAMIYASVQGHLDAFPCKAIKKFEKEFLKFLGVQFPEYTKKIQEEKKLTAEIREKLDQLLKEFCKSFKAA